MKRKLKHKYDSNASDDGMPYVHFSDDATGHRPKLLTTVTRSNSSSPAPSIRERGRSAFSYNMHPSIRSMQVQDDEEEYDDEEEKDAEVSYHSDPGYNCNDRSNNHTRRHTVHNESRTTTGNSKHHHHHHHIHHHHHHIHRHNHQCQHRKILLLGNGSCGKSTMFKQFKMLLGDKHYYRTNAELLSEATHAIRQNLISVLLILLHKSMMLHASDPEYFAKCYIDDNDSSIRESIQFVMKYRTESFEKMTMDANQDDYSDLQYHIARLWQLECVQTTMKYRHKRFIVPDNMEYFYDSVHRVLARDYTPNMRDIIQLRIRTTGMIEAKHELLHDGFKYEVAMFDTGGERNERKKWIHSFENVDVVMFVAALSHFCCVLWEDEKTLSMHDAINLFAEICNGRWFRRSEMILLLNKNDLFRELLYQEISMAVGFGDVKVENYYIESDQELRHKQMKMDKERKSKCFANINAWCGERWDGPNFKFDESKNEADNQEIFEKCYDKAIEFIVSLFLKQNRDPNKTVYVHITTAIDEENMQQVFEEIKPLIINSNYAGHSKKFF